MSKKPIDKPNVRVEVEFTKDELTFALAERVYRRLSDGEYGESKLERDVRKHVHALIERQAEAVIARMTETAIQAEVETLLANGWEITNSYGHSMGKRSVKDMVISHLTSKADSYQPGTRLDKIAKEMIEESLKNGLNAEIEALKGRVKKALTDHVEGSMRKAFTDALGLKL